LLGKRTQDLAGKFEDFEFRAVLTVAYYSLAFAKNKFNLKNRKNKQNIFDANAYVIFKT
jgi:hypothetical protein